MTIAGDRPPPGFDRRPAPEFVAGVIAVIIVGVVGASALASGPARPSDLASPPAARSSPSSVVAPPTPVVDPSVVALLRALNERLDEYGRALDEASSGPFRTADVASLIRQINSAVRLGIDQVSALRGALGEGEAGARLAALYRSMADTAEAALGASLENVAQYRLGAGLLIERIAELPALQAELDALALPPIATFAPSPTAASPTPGPTASPTPPPATPPPSPASTPTASVPPSSAAPIPGDQIVDGGFESGVAAPWVLLVAPGASATLSADTNDPASGAAAARVDIAVGSPAYAGISLTQRGLRLEAGAQYTVMVAVRAAGPRDIRIRIAGADGASYLTRLAPASTTWTTQAFTFIAPVSDEAAVLHVDLGRSAANVWLDTISFAPFGAPAPSL